MRSRRSRSISSVTSTGTTNSDKLRNNSNASQASNEPNNELVSADAKHVLAYKVAMLGDAGVGKTALTYQFTTSDYICAYDLSLDDDYGQKTVSVLLDGHETDLEIVDHPACEMSTEAFCSTYNIDLFVVVYSVVDRKSFKFAEKVLHYLRDSEMLLTRGAILVGNKTDLERHREVPRQGGRRLAKEVACKFIETSSGLDHNVNELLVGIVAQVKLNPLRISHLTDQQRLNLNITVQKHRKVTDRPAPGKQYVQNAMRKLEPEKTLVGDNEIGGKEIAEHFLVAENFAKKDSDAGIGCSSGKSNNAIDGTQPTPKKTFVLEEKGGSSKMSVRTKYLLTSFLKFKRTLRAKRRNSNSCSDLFVI